MDSPRALTFNTSSTFFQTLATLGVPDVLSHRKFLERALRNLGFQLSCFFWRPGFQARRSTSWSGSILIEQWDIRSMISDCQAILPSLLDIRIWQTSSYLRNCTLHWPAHWIRLSCWPLGAKPTWSCLVYKWSRRSSFSPVNNRRACSSRQCRMSQLVMGKDEALCFIAVLWTKPYLFDRRRKDFAVQTCF